MGGMKFVHSIVKIKWKCILDTGSWSWGCNI